jgi:hypothetical protein
MNFHSLNVFLAWLLMLEVVAMGWIAFAGRMLLELLGANTYEGDIPGRLVGLILLFGALISIAILRGSLKPVGKPGGNGFGWGHRLVLGANMLAAVLFCYEFAKPYMQDRALVLLIANFTDAFGYWVLAMWAVGFSLIYQSALSVTSSTAVTK